MQNTAEHSEQGQVRRLRGLASDKLKNYRESVAQYQLLSLRWR